MCYLFLVQKALCSASYEEKKTYKPNVFPPAAPRHGKNQTFRTHRKSPPRLAPKTKPQTRRETIHRDVQERDPNPSAGPQVTQGKESKKRLDTTTIANMPNPRTRTVESGWGGGSTVGSDRKVVTGRRLGETKEAVRYHDQP